jgi:hypothetical protein
MIPILIKLGGVHRSSFGQLPNSIRNVALSATPLCQSEASMTPEVKQQVGGNDYPVEKA